MTTLETLTKARALLMEHGWLQGDMGKSAKGFCAVGAVLRVAKTRDEAFRAMRLMGNIVGIGPRHDVRRRLMSWNNTRGRKREEVLSLVDRALALASEPYVIFSDAAAGHIASAGGSR